MLIISYDIENNKLRTRFAKYLCKFGYRLQYSVFEIKHTETVLKNILIMIKSRFEKEFTQTDSIIIFELSATCKKHTFGYARNDDTDLIVL